MKSRKQTSLYGVNALLASAVLYFALDLSRGDRGPVDTTVITLISGAILWNLIQVGRRLHTHGGPRCLLRLGLTLTAWIVAIFNTLLIRPEDVGRWRNVVGLVVFALAVMNTGLVLALERRAVAEGSGSAAGETQPR